MDKNKSAAEYLAIAFSVEPWSHDQMRILDQICRRFKEVADLLTLQNLPQSSSQSVQSDFDSMRQAFWPGTLNNHWSGLEMQHLLHNIRVLDTAASEVHRRAKYPAITDETIVSILKDLNELRKALVTLQEEDAEFIRQALLDGLVEVEFRIRHLRWLGRGYAARSLKEVITAYLILEGKYPQPEQNPPAAALLWRLRDFVVGVFAGVGLAKETLEQATFVTDAFRLAQTAFLAAPSISGYLTHDPGG